MTVQLPEGPQGPKGAIHKEDLLQNMAFYAVNKGPNPHNHEVQEYKTSNANIEKEKIILTAKQEGSSITSASIRTKGKWTTSSNNTQTHGYIEVRATVPAKAGAETEYKGAWPAIWMMPERSVTWPHGGEIDIMESIHGSPDTYMTLHSSSNSGSGTSNTGRAAPGSPFKFPKNDFTEIPGIFGCEWNMHDNQIDLTFWTTVYSEDDAKWETNKPTTIVITKGKPGDDYEDFAGSFQNGGYYLIANIAVGGAGSWPGPVANPMSPSPQTMKIFAADAYGF